MVFQRWSVLWVVAEETSWPGKSAVCMMHPGDGFHQEERGLFLNKRTLDIHMDLERDTLYVKLRNLKVHTTRQEGNFAVDYSQSGQVVGVEILHLRNHLQQHGKVRIPPRYLQDHPAPLTDSKRKRLRAAVMATSGILDDPAAEKLIEDLSRSRGRDFIAPKDPS